jgi:L-amino acid N-acyltransferase YncA
MVTAGSDTVPTSLSTGSSTEEDRRIRVAAAEDFDTLLALKSEQSNIYWSGFDSAPDTEDFRRWFTTLPNTRTVYLAEVGGRAAGYLYLDVAEKMDAPAEIAIGVGEKYRGARLATWMLEEIARQFGTDGSGCDLVAWIFLDNEPSINAFERAGFIRDETIECRRVSRADAPDGVVQSIWRYNLEPEISSATNSLHSPVKFGIPFTYSDLQCLDNWRDRLVWPVDTAELRYQGEQAIRTVLKILKDTPNEQSRQILTVASPRIINRFQSLSEAALVAQAAAESGMEIFGGPPEIRMLNGTEDRGERTQDHDPQKGIEAITAPNKTTIRAILRTKSYTPWRQFPAALMRRDGLAISHNRLMLSEMRRSGKAIKFQHSATILSKIRASNSWSRSSATELAKPVIANLMALLQGLNEPFRSRLESLLRSELSSAMELIGSDINAIRSFRDLPSRLWCGTNGAYGTRLISSEVRRRGGEVDGFDHGGVTGISQLPELTALTELMMVDRFTVGSPLWKNAVDNSGALDLLTGLNNPKIEAGDGEPTFIDACGETSTSTSQSPCVLYVGHPFRGLRQFAISAVPDSIYWEFQERLIRTLQRLPIDLICKPHPEGFFKGGRTPIDKLATTSYRPFEEHLNDADIFLFDAPTSTTFMEAMCTYKRVVLLDRGHYPFSPIIAPQIESRCSIISLEYDERGRMLVDDRELENALCSNSASPDPTYFRRLVAANVTRS